MYKEVYKNRFPNDTFTVYYFLHYSLREVEGIHNLNFDLENF